VTTDPQTADDFDGCNRKCRLAGAHTLVWGACEHAVQPEPTVSLSRRYTAADGFPAIGFDTYTVQQLAELIERGMRGAGVRVSAGRYGDLAHAAAVEIATRHRIAAPPTTEQTALREVVAEALMGWAERNNDSKLAAYRRPEIVRQNAYSRADAVLAVLPATDRAAALAEDLRYALGHHEPGHDHEQPGVWDTSGEPCGHCARLAVAQQNLAAYDAGAVLPAPADRSAGWLDAAAAIDRLRATLAPSTAHRYESGLGLAATELRRLAAEAPHTATPDAPAVVAQPGKENDTEATAPPCTHRPNHCWGCPGGCTSCQCHAADRVGDDEAETL
jgi:hypothetical protein